MKRDETIKRLIDTFNLLNQNAKYKDFAEAVNYAIAKLDKPVAHWLPTKQTIKERLFCEKAICSHCKMEALEIDGEGNFPNYCPHCGTKMEV